MLEQVGRAAAVHRHRLPRHRLRRHAARRGRGPRRSSDDRRPAGRRPPAPPAVADFLATRPRRRPTDADARADAVAARRRRRHPLHLGHDRAAQGRRCSRTTQRLRTFDAWANMVGLREGDRYLSSTRSSTRSGYKAGILACFLQGATIVPAAGVRRARRCSRTSPPSASRCCPARRRSTCRSSTTPTATRSTSRPAPRGHRRRGGAGRDDPSACATSSTFQTIVTGYGLTESTGTVTMCRHDDDPETISHTSGRAIDGRRGADRRRRRRRGAAGRARRDRRAAGYNVMLGYFDDRGGDARSDRRRRLAPHRRHRDDGRARLPADHRPQEGHVHRRRVQRVPGRDRERCPRATPTSRRSRWSACPTSGMGEVGVAFVVPRPGATVDPDELHRLVPRADGQLQGAAPGGRRRAAAERERQGARSLELRARARRPHVR